LVVLALLVAAGGAGAASRDAKPLAGRQNLGPVWSPDARRIAFVSSKGGGDSDVWLMRADGTNLLDLTPDALAEGSPAWSPDGRELAIVSAPVSPSAQPSVEIIAADGGGRRRLATGSGPAWSPDGTRIAYSADDGLHVAGSDGNGDRLIAPIGRTAWRSTAWSPDGAQLAYVRDDSLWLVGADGGGLRQLTSFSSLRVVADPVWAPTGSTIGFVVVGPYTAPEPNDVWAVDADGSHVRRLASFAFLDGGVSWAPDGSSLVFAGAKTRDGDVDIYRVPAGRGSAVDLSNDHAWDEGPQLAGDGRRIVFTVHHGSGYLLSDVWTLNLVTRVRTNLTGIASGETIDARAVRPPDKLVLAGVEAHLDRTLATPVLRIRVRVSDRKRDEVGGAVVDVAPTARGLVPLKVYQPLTDVHGQYERDYRVTKASTVRVGSRIEVRIGARPRKPYAASVAVARRFTLPVGG
jgi:Tol biopolymer transport system component